MISKSDILKHRREIIAVAARNGASNVRIFGSVAHRDATETSDLDLLVSFEPGRSLMDHGMLIEELQDLLKVKVDVVSEGALARTRPLPPRSAQGGRAAMRTDRLLLEDMRDAIKIVRRYTPAERTALDTDLPVQSLLLRYIQIIGEAASRLSDALRTAHPQVPWQRLAAMRHVLVHDYFRVDLDQVWNVVIVHVPALEPQIDALVASLPPDPSHP